MSNNMTAFEVVTNTLPGKQGMVMTVQEFMKNAVSLGIHYELTQYGRIIVDSRTGEIVLEERPDVPLHDGDMPISAFWADADDRFGSYNLFQDVGNEPQES